MFYSDTTQTFLYTKVNATIQHTDNTVLQQVMWLNQDYDCTSRGTYGR